MSLEFPPSIFFLDIINKHVYFSSMEPYFLTKKQVMEYLGVNRYRINKLIKDRKISYYQLSPRWTLFTQEDIDIYLAEQK